MPRLKISKEAFYSMASSVVSKMSVAIGLGLTILWTSLIGYGFFSLIWGAI
jgi:hypothetical protein